MWIKDQEIIRQMFQAELTLAACEEEAAYGAALSSADPIA